MFRSLFSGLAVIFLTASTLPAQDWARKLLATTEHDFGSVARGAKADYAFVVTNNLQSDVHIASVRSSCGCTTPYVENDKRTLKTYEKGAIIAHLNSDTHVGQRAATLTVTFDQPYYAEVQLQIRALVHTNILMEPASLQFGTVEQGKASEARVRLYRADFPNWQIQRRSLLRSESARRSGPGGAAGRPGLVRFEGPPGPHGLARLYQRSCHPDDQRPRHAARSPCRLKGRCGPTWWSAPRTSFWA